MTPASSAPVATAQRAGVLDALRAIALLGICIANAGVLSLYFFQPEKSLEQWPGYGADRILRGAELVLVDGKFYSLFSLLFGIGFAIIFFEKKGGGRRGLLFFYRRLFFLLLIGLTHYFFLWDGDILFFYALVGAFLPLFRNCGNRTLLILAGAVLLSPLLFDAVKVLTDNRWNISHPFFDQAIAQDARSGITEKNVPTWLIEHDRYSDVLAWNRSGFWWSWQMRLDSNRVPKVLAMFLLGLALGRSRFYLNLDGQAGLLKKIRFWGLLLGLMGGLLRLYFEIDGRRLPHPAGLLDTFFYAWNTAPLALGYAATVCLWWTEGKKARLLNWLQPAGRMALTNYLAQSVFGVLLYYGFGLGLGSRVGPSVFIPICFLFFGVQVLYSRWWLSRYAYGPVEWIWRQLTYGRRLALRQRAAAVPV